MLKKFYGFIGAVLVSICFLPMTANANTISTADLGHGAGCQHTHNSYCYSQTYHTLGEATTDGAIWDSCPYDRDSAVMQYREICSVCGKYKAYLRCSRPSCTYRVEQVSLPTYCSSVLSCNKGTYGDCRLPSISFDVNPSTLKWTNQDVVLHYSGTANGALTFADNQTQSVI